MERMLFYIVLVIIGISFSSYIYMIYGKLKKYKEEVDVLWNDLRLKIEEQFIFIKDNKNALTSPDNNLDTLLNNYFLTAYKEDVMNYYISLVHFVDTNASEAIAAHFKDKDKVIDEIKEKYNNVLLRYNNVVNMIPNKFIALIFHFAPDIYFRDK